MEIQLYDTTMRDGVQREGISFSVEDKIRIAGKLDELGIHFIEGGWPGSNSTDTAFFQRMQKKPLLSSTLVAFGSTRRAGICAEDDPNLQALLDSGAGVVTLVGKGSIDQVKNILKTSPEENLAMIADSIVYLKSKGLKVFFDAEHFFDGYKFDADYAVEAVRAAARAGADCVIPCDTNGGTLPNEVEAIVTSLRQKIDVSLGIHAHNDAEVAVANSLAAVRAGAVQVQGTINGYGERCGNANLCSIIPALKLKMGIDCIDSDQLLRLTEVSRFLSEVSNLQHDTHLPYVGKNAFGHKGGMHIAAMAKNAQSYQHVDPALVGNQSQIFVSEMSGVNTIIYKAKEKGFDFSARKEQAKQILAQIKSLEAQGFKYDNAEASFEVLLQRAQPEYKPPFELVDFMVVVEKDRRPSARGETALSEAMVKVRVGEDIFHTAAEGNGPVNALDAGLRKALLQFYPELSVIKLIDYKVRILAESEGTESSVRVLIESTDGEEVWQTVGSSPNIIEASWIALADSMEYWLLRKAKSTSVISSI